MVIFCCHILAASLASSTASYQYEGQIKGCLIDLPSFPHSASESTWSLRSLHQYYSDTGKHGPLCEQPAAVHKSLTQL